MLKQDTERKARNIVPLWLLDSDNPVLARMARRPVGVDFDELGVSLTGELKELSLTHARVMPDRTFFLCRSMYVEIRFRYLDTVYTLSGDACPSLPDNSFIFHFDSVARKAMGDLGRRLGALGLLDASRELPPGAKPCEQTPADCKQTTQQTQRQARRTRHQLPPGGLERRAAHRYDLDTVAYVNLVREERRLECVMVNMSKSGCRLYCEEPGALQPGLLIEVQFTENGYPLRLAGVVQVCTGEHSAGVRFVRNSARMSERLDSLLWEMAELESGRS